MQKRFNKHGTWQFFSAGVPADQYDVVIVGGGHNGLVASGVYNMKLFKLRILKI